MPAELSLSRTMARATILWIIVALFACTIQGQRPGSTGSRISGASPNGQQQNPGTEVDVSVRDTRGGPLNVPAVVRLYSMTSSYNVSASTRDASTAYFLNVLPGEYELEVTSLGYGKTTEHLSLLGNGARMPVYVNMLPESDGPKPAEPSHGVVMTPQLRSQMQKGLEALNKKQYEAAKAIFTKSLQKAPGNPDIVYFLGVAELGLQHVDLARENFQHAVSLDPNHEMALVSLGELQLKNGTAAEAIIPLEKAVGLGHAGWRAHFELAYAYAKANRLSEAESEASRAAHLAKEKGATPTFFLGQIQFAEGKHADAQRTWQSVLAGYPSDPIVAQTKKMLARLETESRKTEPFSNASLPLPPAPNLILETVVERPWAPLDIDSAAYDIFPDANCRTEQILDGALHRLKSDLVDFEKFTATEHIEHQEIDRYGWPGPVKARNFSYVVFVHHIGDSSVYLEESRMGGDDLSAFPTALATTGLNSLGVSVLQSANRERFRYSCEGLTNLRGNPAWQIRFEERRDAKVTDVRSWRRNGKIYEIPIKGRIWMASASYAVLRIETDLREPVAKLELNKDHLLVDYGPVTFSSGNAHLWLPLSAEMYMVLRGKRYHHRHFLSDYLLFGVDTTHAIGKPKELPPPAVDSSP